MWIKRSIFCLFTRGISMSLFFLLDVIHHPIHVNHDRFCFSSDYVVENIIIRCASVFYLMIFFIWESNSCDILSLVNCFILGHTYLGIIMKYIFIFIFFINIFFHTKCAISGNGTIAPFNTIQGYVSTNVPAYSNGNDSHAEESNYL